MNEAEESFRISKKMEEILDKYKVKEMDQKKIDFELDEIICSYVEKNHIDEARRVFEKISADYLYKDVLINYINDQSD
jgi:pentatricopeptide repeat protein